MTWKATVRRKAAAPLEFVLVLPLLTLLAMCTFWMGAAGFVKSQAVAAARRDAWLKRSRADAGLPLQFPHDPLAGLAESHLRIPMPGPAPFSRKTSIAKAEAAVIAKSWDFHDITTSLLAEPFVIWPEPLKHLCQNVAGMSQHLGQLAEFRKLDPKVNALLAQLQLGAAAHRQKRLEMAKSLGSANSAVAQAATLMPDPSWDPSVLRDCLAALESLLSACRNEHLGRPSMSHRR